MEERIVLDSVGRYNELFGLPTAHPLVSVVDLSQATRTVREVVMSYGVYALFLKQVRCGDIRYGRQTYDYQEGTVTSFAPGQVVEVRMDPETRPSAKGLLFHPDLIRGTSLGREIKRYSFFAYSSNEALHLSDEEKVIFTDCLNKIRLELERPADSHSKRLIVRNIELLLDYCSRFYERQFITREEKNKSLLRRLERLVDSGIDEGCLERGHFPTAAEWAADLGLSEAYFCDLLRFQTGKTPTEYLYFRRLEAAKRMLQADRATPAQVSRRLGFANVCQFSFVFKKYTGQAPGEYRLN